MLEKEIQELVVKQYNNGSSIKDVAQLLEIYGIMNRIDAELIVKEIIQSDEVKLELSKNGIVAPEKITRNLLKKKQNEIAKNRLSKRKKGRKGSKNEDLSCFIKEFLFFLAGTFAVFLISITCSILLGIIENGLGDLGKFIGELGGQGVGVLIGLLVVAMSQNYKSLSLYIGCLFGMLLYYFWFFSKL